MARIRGKGGEFKTYIQCYLLLHCPRVCIADLTKKALQIIFVLSFYLLFMIILG